MGSAIKPLIWPLAGILVLIALPPLAFPSYVLAIAINILMFAAWSSAWNLIGGLSGQLSAGHALFIGIGVYASTVLHLRAGWSPWAGMLVGMALAAGASGIIAGLSFRYGIGGIFFALLTLSAAEIGRSTIGHIPLLGGSQGLTIPANQGFWSLQFSPQGYYLVILGMLLVILAITWAIHRSRMGYYLKAIRNNENAAKSVGIDCYKWKVIISCISAALTAMVGTFFAQYLRVIDPHAIIHWQLSVEVMLPAILGGVRSQLGPVVGAVVMVSFGEAARALAGARGANLLVLGLLLILVIEFMPDGIAGLFNRRRRRPGVPPPSGPPAEEAVSEAKAMGG